jgi:hypothetical protein
MTAKSVIFYKGFRLTTIEPSGAFQVEIVATEGGRSFLTAAFPDPASALASARRLLDNGFKP